MKTKIIQVFEYDILYVDELYNNVIFGKNHYIALSKLNILHNDKYFEIRYNGIKFKQFVGVIQIDGLTIEILPKIDYCESEENKNKWQKVLIDMLRVTKRLQVQKAGHANVSKQSIHLLDIYFEWFLNEIQVLIHQGLIKQYYSETDNVKAWKGKLEFSGHIQKNLVHKERFYTTHQVYEKDHLIHQILGQALGIIARLSKGTHLYSKCKTVQLDFPDVKSIKANESIFTKVPKSKKTAPYETALSIARLIILNYAPNISSGSEKMLALLFDMNRLWEEYVLVKLKQVCQDNDMEVYGQNSTSFWNTVSIRPDIVVKKKSENIITDVFIIDTKWKNIDQSQPSTHDLRQMYVYNEYWESKKSLLLYPSGKDEKTQFEQFQPLKNKEDHHRCGLGKISVLDEDGKLYEDLGHKILKLFKE